MEKIQTNIPKRKKLKTRFLIPVLSLFLISRPFMIVFSSGIGSGNFDEEAIHIERMATGELKVSDVLTDTNGMGSGIPQISQTNASGVPTEKSISNSGPPAPGNQPPAWTPLVLTCYAASYDYYAMVDDPDDTPGSLVAWPSGNVGGMIPPSGPMTHIWYSPNSTTIGGSVQISGNRPHSNPPGANLQLWITVTDPHGAMTGYNGGCFVP